MKKLERLKVLGKYLTSGAVDESRFDMALWSSCAIGEGSRIPSLVKEGLTVIFESGKNIGGFARFFGIPVADAKELFGCGSGNAYDYGYASATGVQVGKKILAYTRKREKAQKGTRT